MHFCIDRFEYPNRKGEYPVVYVDWYESNRICESDGKRLCTEEEWTFACEGEEALPYPYGYDRDKDACLVDKPWRWFDPSAYGGRKAALIRELDHLWQGVPSGFAAEVQEPVRRLRHDGERRRVHEVDVLDRQSGHPQGRLLGTGPYAMSPHDARSRAPARLLSAGLPVLPQ